MPFVLFVLGVAYAFFALSASGFGVGGKEVAALHADIRDEIARGGAMSLACRFIQPLIWLLVLPMEKLSLALASAGFLVCFGVVL